MRVTKEKRIEHHLIAQIGCSLPMLMVGEQSETLRKYCFWPGGGCYAR